MILALLLSVVVGVSLGLLGGGGSILAVPLLVYVLGVPPKSAIAMSLVIVGTTSLVAMLQHARADRVRWRKGLLFGVASMGGAFGGGHTAQYIPGSVLLLLFAVMMVVMSVAMLRRDDERVATPTRKHAKLPIGKTLAEGTVVGFFTGLVGAGGGFVIVPALVLLGGFAMPAAIGTSLLVIGIKSFAGLLGHITHVTMDWPLVALVTSGTVAGSLLGGMLVGKVPRQILRKGFAWFVLAVAAFMVAKELPALRQAPWFEQMFVERWPWYVGGLAIASVAVFMLWWDNRLLGVSTGCQELCTPKVAKKSWRPSFLLGIVGGAAVSGLLAGASPTFAFGNFDVLFGASHWVKGPLLLLAGVLIGVGARAAGGCTSGHSIVGMAQLARSSLVASVMFMAAGFLTTHLLWRTLGGL